MTFTQFCKIHGGSPTDGSVITDKRSGQQFMYRDYKVWFINPETGELHLTGHPARNAPLKGASKLRKELFDRGIALWLALRKAGLD